MKKAIAYKVFLWVTMALAGELFLLGCQKETSKNDEEEKIIYAKELGYDTPVVIDIYDEILDSVEIDINSNVITVYHYNLVMECGYMNIDVNVHLQNDTIFALEDGIYEPHGDCLCKTTNRFQILNVPKGNLILSVAGRKGTKICKSITIQ